MPEDKPFPVWPLPWRVEIGPLRKGPAAVANYRDARIVCADGATVGVCAPLTFDVLNIVQDGARSELETITRAVNAHDELIAALESARGFVDRHSEDWYSPGQELLARIDAALLRAKEG